MCIPISATIWKCCKMKQSTVHLGARVRRLVTHSHEQSCILSAVQGNNEVSLWDMETGARQRTLWASSAPPLSTSQVRGTLLFHGNVHVCCYKLLVLLQKT